MFFPELTTAVENFAHRLAPVPDLELGRPWKWKSHETEGVRFAFFVTLQELRHLAVELTARRTPPTPAQHILGQYHAAYLDLQAALLGLSAEAGNKIPAEGEWPVRRIYAHLLGADLGFTGVIRYALEGHRAGNWKAERASDEDFLRILGLSEAEYEALLEGPLEAMQAFHREFHFELLAEFAAITNEELDLPAVFWEDEHFPIHHRLHRYEAHLVQHTIQIDKTLAALGLGPNEAQRLARKVYAALAEAEAAMLGADEISAAGTGLAETLVERTAEIQKILE
jgi:hypothetical protein